ncbi:trans-aconitate 2-methyltransferase [Salinisphaera sp. T31B1]|uniref:trans-aconitate 2-methyltransferase n=1 Tax=Salinisphaera sp. T31B1 TaxID=727963 RepID=UPI00333F21F3
MDWSSKQYVKFEAERNQPIHDLLARLPVHGVHRIADLGCGPGNSTQLLRQHYPEAEIIGIDRSSDMLTAARERLPRLTFDQIDIADWRPTQRFDLVFANASLHWLGEHHRLFKRLLTTLAPGGRLAIQMPDNLDEPAHALMREVAAEPRWAPLELTTSPLRAPRHTPSWYVARLKPHVASLDVWRTTYHHLIADGVDGVVEWFKGSGLRPYLAPLGADDRDAFLEAYRRRLAAAYPVLDDGTLVLPFPRLFMVLGVE